MTKQRLGFTILEVVLVLAISTLLFMSITIGLSQRIAYARYNTAATEVTDFLRDAFSSVLNTDNGRSGNELSREYCTLSGATTTNNYANGRPIMAGNTSSNASAEDYSNYPGRTNCAIYGKIIFFGVSDDTIYAIDIVGDAVDQQNAARIHQIEISEGVLAALEAVNADYAAAIYEDPDNQGTECIISPAASYRTYNLSWGTMVKTANYGELSGLEINDNFVGAVMIVRAPSSGSVATFFYEGPSIGEYVSRITGEDDNRLYIGCSNLTENSIADYTLDYQAFKDYLPTYDNGEAKNEGFCISSDDFWVASGNLRKFVSFTPDGQTPSSIDLDASEENPCRRKS